MKKKVIISVLFFIVICIFSCTFANAAENVLLISNDDVISGSAVKSYLENISNNDYAVTQVSIKSGTSFADAVKGITNTGVTYDYVIVQESAEHISSSDSIVSELGNLQKTIGDSAKTEYFISTPWGELTDSASAARGRAASLCF